MLHAAAPSELRMSVFLLHKGIWDKQTIKQPQHRQHILGFSLRIRSELRKYEILNWQRLRPTQQIGILRVFTVIGYRNGHQISNNRIAMLPYHQPL